MITTIEPAIKLSRVGGERIESVYALSKRVVDRLDLPPVSFNQIILG